MEVAPSLPAADAGTLQDLQVDDIPVWDGTRFDVVWAVDVFAGC